MELEWLLAIQDNLTSPWADSLMVGLSTLGDHGLVWILIALGLCAMPKWRRAGLAMLAALLLAHLTGNVLLKNLIGRPRPYLAYPGISLKIPPLNEFSFPSGHTIAAFAAVFALPPSLGGLKRTLSVLATAVAFSRLYLFMHYPSDVLGGALLGVAIGAAVSRIPWFRLK